MNFIQFRDYRRGNGLQNLVFYNDLDAESLQGINGNLLSQNREYQAKEKPLSRMARAAMQAVSGGRLFFDDEGQLVLIVLFLVGHFHQ